MVSRIAFGLCVAAVAAAIFLPMLFGAIGWDIQVLKWPTIFYGMIALLGLIPTGCVWIALELDQRHKMKLRSNG